MFAIFCVSRGWYLAPCVLSFGPFVNGWPVSRFKCLRAMASTAGHRLVSRTRSKCFVFVMANKHRAREAPTFPVLKHTSFCSGCSSSATQHSTLVSARCCDWCSIDQHWPRLGGSRIYKSARVPCRLVSTEFVGQNQHLLELLT